MKVLEASEIEIVDGGLALATVGRIVTLTAPGRAVVGAAMLGWAIGSAINRTYGDQIGDAIYNALN